MDHSQNWLTNMDLAYTPTKNSFFFFFSDRCSMDSIWFVSRSIFCKFDVMMLWYFFFLLTKRNKKNHRRYFEQTSSLQSLLHKLQKYIYTHQPHVIASKCKSKLKPKRDDMHKQNSCEPNDSAACAFFCLFVAVVALPSSTVDVIVVVISVVGGFEAAHCWVECTVCFVYYNYHWKSQNTHSCTRWENTPIHFS